MILRLAADNQQGAPHAAADALRDGAEQRGEGAEEEGVKGARGKEAEVRGGEKTEGGRAEGERAEASDVDEDAQLISSQRERGAG